MADPTLATADPTMPPATAAFYVPPAVGESCVDFSSLVIYNNYDCKDPMKPEDVEAWKAKNIMPGFLS
jgi:hypothetical protein